MTLILPVAPKQKPRLTARDREFYRRYVGGETLEQIGASWGITRERVRQRLQIMGISGRDGGAHFRSQLIAKLRAPIIERAKQRRAARIAKRHADTCQRWFLCSVEEFQAATGMSLKQFWSARNKTRSRPIERYYTLALSARRRGIGWALTLPQYLAIWEASGKTAGRGPNDYCMGRLTGGPFALGNVRICTNSENIRHGYTWATGADRAAKARLRRQEAACSI